MRVLLAVVAAAAVVHALHSDATHFDVTPTRVAEVCRPHANGAGACEVRMSDLVAEDLRMHNRTVHALDASSGVTARMPVLTSALAPATTPLHVVVDSDVGLAVRGVVHVASLKWVQGALSGHNIPDSPMARRHELHVRGGSIGRHGSGRGVHGTQAGSTCDARIKELNVITTAPFTIEAGTRLCLERDGFLYNVNSYLYVRQQTQIVRTAGEGGAVINLAGGVVAFEPDASAAPLTCPPAPYAAPLGEVDGVLKAWPVWHTTSGEDCTRVSPCLDAMFEAPLQNNGTLRVAPAFAVSLANLVCNNGEVRVEAGGVLAVRQVTDSWSWWYLESSARVVMLPQSTGGLASFTNTHFDGAQPDTLGTRVTFCTDVDLRQVAFGRGVTRTVFRDAEVGVRGDVMFEGQAAFLSGRAWGISERAGNRLLLRGEVLWDATAFPLPTGVGSPAEGVNEVQLDVAAVICGVPREGACSAASPLVASYAPPWRLYVRNTAIVRIVDLSNAGGRPRDAAASSHIVVPNPMFLGGARLEIETFVCFTAGGVWAPSPYAVVTSPGREPGVYGTSSLDNLSVGIGFGGVHIVLCDPGWYDPYETPASIAGSTCRLGRGLSEVHVMSGATLEFAGGAVVAADAKVSIDEDATVMVDAAGATFDAPLTHVDVGSTVVVSRRVLVDDDASTVDTRPTILHFRGDVNLSGNLSVALQESCDPPIVVSGSLVVQPTASISCNGPMYGTPQQSGVRVMYMAAQSLSVAPDVTFELDSCTAFGSAEAETAHTSLALIFTSSKTGLGKQLLCAAAVGIIVSAVVLRILVAQHGQRIFSCSATEPPVHLALTWPEFKPYAQNFVAVGIAVYECLVFVAAANHPNLPRPPGWTGAGELLYDWLLLRGLSPSVFQVGFYVTCAAVWIWALLWVPLLPLCVRLSPKAGWMYDLHRMAAIAGNVLFIPALLLLAAPLDCSYDAQSGLSLLRAAPRTVCWRDSDHGTLVLLSLSALPFLPLLNFHSSSSLSFPFAHPPYSSALDVRYKRTYEAARCVLLLVQVLVLAVFADNAVVLAALSWIVLAIFLALFAFGYPCAYHNINRLRARLVAVCLWWLTTSLIGALAYGYPYATSSCETYGIWLIPLDAVGAIAVVAVSVYAGRRNGGYRNDPDDDFGAACETVQGMLVKMQEQMAALKKQKSTAGALWMDEEGSAASPMSAGGEQVMEASRCHPTAVAMEIRRIDGKFREDLESYRAVKDRYSLAFYMGQPTPSLDVLASTTHALCRSVGRKSLLPHETEMYGVRLGTEHDKDAEENVAGWVKGQLLGRGSYGSVYTGILRSGKLLAVKVVELREERSKVKAEIERVTKEVDFIKHLKHPNIIAYKACVIDHDALTINIFMEYAVGGSLASLVKKTPEGLAENTIRLYVRQILAGLAYLHDNNIVHRDIKGDNVLLDASGVVKVADFGCAREWDASGAMQCATFVGSPYWMAPEVIMKTGHDAKADIWSVGCTAVEVLNRGGLPWKEFGTVMAAMYHIHNSHEQPNNIPSDISLLCRAFLNQCFDRDPTKRPTAKELARHPWVCEVDLHEPPSSPCAPLERSMPPSSMPLASAPVRPDDFMTLDSVCGGTVSTVMTPPPDTLLPEGDWAPNRPDPLEIPPSQSHPDSATLKRQVIASAAVKSFRGPALSGLSAMTPGPPPSPSPRRANQSARGMSPPGRIAKAPLAADVANSPVTSAGGKDGKMARPSFNGAPRNGLMMI